MSYFEDTLSEGKGNIPILILGSYEDGSFERLISLRDSLRLSGYTRTSLVSELPEPPNMTPDLDSDEYNYEKSIYWIQRSKINLFVFFKGFSYGSVAVEMAEGILLYNMLNCTSFLIENNAHLSLISGFIQRRQCNRKFFSSDDILFQKAKSECWDHMLQDDCVK